MDGDVYNKSGADLYRELLRIYPTAEAEDYFRLGLWLDDRIKLDIHLVCEHRKEAGAGPPTPLEDVPMPEPPKSKFAQALLPGAATAAAGAPNVALLQQQALAHMTSLFLTKWGQKLDATKAKEWLSKLEPTARRFVIQGFKGEGVDVTAQLEAYIADRPWEKVAGALKAVTIPAKAVTLEEFIARNNLDATWTEGLLMGLEAHERSFVLRHFRSSAMGQTATDELEGYIADCPWENAPVEVEQSATLQPAKAAGPVVVAPKRPGAFCGLGEVEAAKRPRIIPAGAGPAMILPPGRAPAATIRHDPYGSKLAGQVTPGATPALILPQARRWSSSRPNVVRPPVRPAGQPPRTPLVSAWPLTQNWTSSGHGSGGMVIRPDRKSVV